MSQTLVERLRPHGLRRQGRRLRRTLPALLAAASVVVAGGAIAASDREPTWQVTTVLVLVPDAVTSFSEFQPTADVNAKLSGTLATVLTSDAAVLDAMAADPDVAELIDDDRLSAELVPGTSLIEVVASGASAEDATRLTSAVEDVVQSDTAISPYLPVGGLRVVDRADSGPVLLERSWPVDLAALALAAAILGITVATLQPIILRTSDGPVRIRRATGAPVVVVHEGPDGWTTLARWTHRQQGRTVLVAPVDLSALTLHRMALLLQRAGADQVDAITDRTPGPDQQGSFLPASAREVQDAAAVVVVVQSWSVPSQVARLLRTVRDLGIPVMMAAGQGVDDVGFGLRERRRLAARWSGWVAMTAAVGAVVGATTIVSPAIPPAAAAAVALAAAVLRTPVVASITVGGVLPAISGLSRSFGVAGLKGSELLLGVCLLALLVRRPALPRRTSAVDITLVVFAGVGIAVAALHTLSGRSDLPSMLRVGLQPAFVLMGFWTVARGIEDAGQVRVVLRVMLVVACVPALLAVAQYLDLPPARQVLLALTDGGLVAQPGTGPVRVTGPWPIWHSLGGYLLVPFTVGTSLLILGDRTVLRRRALLPVLTVLAGGLVLTVTITVIAWAVTAVLIAAVLLRRPVRAVLGLGLLAAVALVLAQSAISERVDQQTTVTEDTPAGGLLPQTLAYRVVVWERDYLPLLARAVGVGLGNDLPEDIIFGSTENQVFTFVLRGGLALALAGYAVVVAVLIAAYTRFRAASRLPSEAADAAPLQAAAAALVGITALVPVTTMIWPYLSNAGFVQAFAALAGLVLGGGSLRTRAANTSEAARSSTTSSATAT